jgi:hypothetical protein
MMNIAIYFSFHFAAFNLIGQVVRKIARSFEVGPCNSQKWGGAGVLQTPDPRKTSYAFVCNFRL